MSQNARVLCLVTLLIFTNRVWAADPHTTPVQWFEWSEMASLLDPLGLSGAFVGLTEEGILVAGGSNFPVLPSEDGQEVFRNAVFLLQRASDGAYHWQNVGKLPWSLAHGAAVSTPEGLVCLGGRGSEGASSKVFALHYDRAKKSLNVRRDYPPLPEPCDNLAATILGQTLYVAGGKNDGGPMDNFWALDLSPDRRSKGPLTWRELPTWPGPPRSGAILISQSNGDHDCLYLFSGKSSDTYLVDAYRFDPTEANLLKTWQPVAPLPRAAFLAPATAWGQSHVLVLGGLDGHDLDHPQKVRKVPKDSPRFVPDILAYHTITDTWTKVGDLPQGLAATTAIEWDHQLILPGGEIWPGIPTSNVYQGTPQPIVCRFGLLDYSMLTGYLVLLVLVGFYFTKREKTTGDFFLGGQRIPWWAAGLSLLATQVSSIGFMAIPAKAYATNWSYFAGVGTWFLVVPIVTRVYIPFFRRLNVTSAYEYLEVRFHLVVRLLGTVTYSLLQLGRMAIVLYLPALALSVVTGMDKSLCIVVMGVLCTAYTVAGGIEAVIWTDVIQAVLLVGGALVCVVTVFCDIDGGPTRFFEIASADGKFHMADFGGGFVTAGLWVVLVGNAFIRLGSLTSDQAVVQRYLTTPDEKASRRALWADVMASIPWAVLVFTFGTALYVFYKLHPDLLSPTLDTDGIVPLFVAQKIPAGLSGLIVAAVFAAAMSSLDSAMHSVATIWVTDFYARFKPDSLDHTRLKLARRITLLLGLFGTITALWMASTDMKSLWDSFQAIIGLFIGGLTALFALGIFTRRTHALGAMIGFATSAVVLAVMIQQTRVHFFLYSAIGFLCCYAVGYTTSLLLRGQCNTEGVTIYSLKKERTKI